MTRGEDDKIWILYGGCWQTYSSEVLSDVIGAWTPESWSWELLLARLGNANTRRDTAGRILDDNVLL